MNDEKMAEKMSRKKSFVINSEHADSICNDLLAGEYETLGRIFVDLVNYNLYGDEAITETECTDRIERHARRLFKTDSEQYIRNWCAKSEQNAKNRTSRQEPTRDEVIAYANAKGYDEQIAIGWSIEQATKNWLDPNGEPIKYWKKTLDSYMRAVNRKKVEQIARDIVKR